MREFVVTGLLDRRGGAQRRGGGALPFAPPALALLGWHRSTADRVTLKTISEWLDQSPSALAFAQSSQALRPLASGGGADGNGTSQLMTAGTTTVTAGAWTIGIDCELDALPGVDEAGAHCVLAQGGGKWAESIVANIAGYQPRTFTAKHGGVGDGNGVGIADALTTDRERMVISYNNGAITDAASYTASLDGVTKVVVASGAIGLDAAGEKNSILGLGRTAPTAWFNGKLYAFVVYSSALSAPNRAALDALLALGTATYADYAALGTVVCCLLPSTGQSGDCLTLDDRGTAGNDVTNATLTAEPLFLLVGDTDTEPTLVYDGTADVLACTDIATFSGLTKLTVSAWVRQDALATATICGQWGGADNCWKLETRVTTGKVRLYTASGAADGANFVESDAAMISAATWVHIGAVLDGATAALYLNGALVASTITGTLQTLRNSARNYEIGSDGSVFFAGRIDDVIVGSRAASAGQMARLAAYFTRAG